MQEKDIRRSAMLASPAMNDGFVSRLRLVQREDAEFICQLRSDPRLNEHLSSSSPEVEVQRAWIDTYKRREAAGEEFYFVIRHQMEDYGVVRMYDFAGNSFCWGSWILRPDRPSGLVTFSAILIYELAFDVLGFDQSLFDVRLGNHNVIDFHLRSGAESISRDGTNQYFVFPRTKWPAFRDASSAQIHNHRVLRG